MALAFVVGQTRVVEAVLSPCWWHLRAAVRGKREWRDACLMWCLKCTSGIVFLQYTLAKPISSSYRLHGSADVELYICIATGWDIIFSFKMACHGTLEYMK